VVVMVVTLSSETRRETVMWQTQGNLIETRFRGWR